MAEPSCFRRLAEHKARTAARPAGSPAGTVPEVVIAAAADDDDSAELNLIGEEDDHG